jgi:4-amino-4-deoxy-L-arabinose transferase-like glycosyltransferase
MKSPPNSHRKLPLALGLILFVGLTLRAWHLVNHLAGPLGHVEEVFTSSDMNSFTVWARQIAGGDWLCRDTFHPYMDWMMNIAPLEQFEEWWGGKAIYHQTPLYAYLLAVSHLLFHSNVPLLILQVLASSASLLLVYDLGRRFLDPRAGLIAAGLAAIFTPSIVFDSIQLRASLNASLTLLSIWLFVRLRESPGRGIAFTTGLCLAGSYLLRPTGLILMGAAPVLLLLEKATRPHWKGWAPALGLAFVVVIAPFAARNLLVGAPLLAFSTRGPETVIQANSKFADPGSMSLPAKDDYVRLMAVGHGSVTRALTTAIDSWPADSSLGWWLWHQWQKVLSMFGDYEYANNVNFYYYRSLTPLLVYLPTFGWFVGFGLVGMVLLGLHGRQRAALWFPLLAVGALVAGCLLGFTMSRYRMPLAVLLTIPSGAAVSLILAWLRTATPRSIALAGVAFLASLTLCVASYFVTPKKSQDDGRGGIFVIEGELRAMVLGQKKLRLQEYKRAAKTLNAAGDPAGAVTLLANYRQALLAEAAARIQEIERSRNALGFFHLVSSNAQTMNRIADLFHTFGADHEARLTKSIADRMSKQAEQITKGN